MKKNTGQSLIEILLALATIVVIITAIAFSIISSLKNNEYSRDQNLATTYAQQGLELIRTQRNNDYATFKSLSGTYCLASTCTTLSSQVGNACGPAGALGCGQNIGIFERLAVVEPSSSSCKGVATKVELSALWTDSQCNTSVNVFCHHVDLVSCLTNIDPIQNN